MKQSLVVWACMLCAPILLSGQNRLSGQISNEQKEGIAFATVVLFQLSDSLPVKSTLTDDLGAFEWQDVKNGAYLLEVSILGYQRQNAVVDFPSDHPKTIDWVLKENAALLSTVEVTARRPLFEQKGDRLVVHVGEHPSSLNGNLLEVLKKVPGLLVIEDRISLAGQTNVTILINGKTTRYMDMKSLLKDMPGDNIQKVELIQQPGAEFDAEGSGAIINIILKKNGLLGTNGTAEFGLAKGRDWKYKSSVSLSTFRRNLNVSGSLGYQAYPYFTELNILRRINGDVYQQRSTDPYPSNTFRTDLNINWDVKEDQQIGLSGRWLDRHSDNLIENETQINYWNDAVEDLHIFTDNDKTDDWQLFSLNPYYRIRFDSEGHQLEADFNWVKIKDDSRSVLSSNEILTALELADQRYLQFGRTDIQTVKLDYSLPDTEYWKFKMGAKFSHAKLDNQLEAAAKSDVGQWIIDPSQSNDFIFEETITALYARADWHYEGWSANIGLRYENSLSESQFVSFDSINSRSIRKLFPSIGIGKNLSEKLKANLSYSYRIDRPEYASLNPFVFFLDPFTFREGNPGLVPALTNSFRFFLTYDNQPFFNVAYKSIENAIVEVTIQNDQSGATSLTKVNLSSFNTWNFSLYFPLDFIPKISGFGGIIANYGKYDAEFLAENLDRARWDYLGFIQANAKLPWKIKTECTAWYFSGTQEGIINSEWLYGVDIGFSRPFLKDRLTMSFGVQNILNRFFFADITFANMDVDLNSRWDGPQFNFQLRYKFGDQFIRNKKGRDSGASDELRRAEKQKSNAIQ
ncbi:MAG: outer membrane beta-barrel protein [Bacteroidota bacterium]